MNFKSLILEDEDLSDVDVEEGKMSDILGVPEDETIADGYDGSPKDAAQELVDAVGESEAASMINYAANISGDEFLEDMQDAIKNIDEQFRGVVRNLIKQELSEMTTTAAGGGYQTPFAFGDEDDEEKEDDIEEFLDTYGWEMAELAKKVREEGSLSDREKEKVKSYISRVRSMRNPESSTYRKKSNYYPVQEQLLGEEVETSSHVLNISGGAGNLSLDVYEKDGGERGNQLASVDLSGDAGDKLHQSIMSKVE